MNWEYDLHSRKIEWESLQKRREDGELMMLYKALNGAATIPTNDLVPPKQAYQEALFPDI